MDLLSEKSTLLDQIRLITYYLSLRAERSEAFAMTQ